MTVVAKRQNYWVGNGVGRTPLVGTFHIRKTIFCLATSLGRLLMLRSAVRGLRLIATSRRGARDLSCSHGGDCAARKVRASASEVKGGGGYGHPLTHGPVFQRDKGLSKDRYQVSVTTVPPSQPPEARSAVPRPLHPKPGTDHFRSRTDLTLPSPPTR